MPIFLLVRRLFNLLPPITTELVGEDTELVGEDTELIVLLCNNASLDSHALFFYSELKNSTKSFVFGMLESQKKSLVKTSATTPSSSMPFLGVTQHHVLMGLERAHPLASSKHAV